MDMDTLRVFVDRFEERLFMVRLESVDVEDPTVSRAVALVREALIVALEDMESTDAVDE